MKSKIHYKVWDSVEFHLSEGMNIDESLELAYVENKLAFSTERTKFACIDENYCQYCRLKKSCGWCANLFSAINSLHRAEQLGYKKFSKIFCSRIKNGFKKFEKFSLPETVFSILSYLCLLETEEDKLNSSLYGYMIKSKDVLKDIGLLADKFYDWYMGIVGTENFLKAVDAYSCNDFDAVKFYSLKILNSIKV